MKYRIVYMGTPEFAVSPLTAIANSEIEIAAVVTVPDKPAGRGLTMHESPVKKWAIANGVDVLQPVSLKDAGFISQLQSYHADLFVVVAFRMLPKDVWAMPKDGTINLHASLLPKYRGAAPINRAIMNGESVTGLTTFFIDEIIDNGSIIDFIEIPIGYTTTAGELHDEMMEKGSQLLLKTIRSIRDKKNQTIPQISFAIPDEALPAAPKIFRDDCRINFLQDAWKVYNQIRGLSPYPAAFATFSVNGKPTSIKITGAEYIEGKHKTPAGTLLSDYKTHLTIVCENGLIRITELQPEGKKRMSVSEFLRGARELTL